MGELSRTALIALGCNQPSVWGDAALTAQKATTLVAKLSTNAAIVSDLVRTPAFPAGSGPDFVNAVMAISTRLSPQDLLTKLHQIEAEAGRTRTVRWGQRTLDLDLLAMGDVVAPDLATFTYWRDLSADSQQQIAPKELILPHPRMQDRAFVLVPLCDVAPDWTHPVFGQTARAMCDALPTAERQTVVRLS